MPGCPRLVRRGRCREHQQAYDDARRPRRRIYLAARWQQARARALSRAGGQCQMLDNGYRCPARAGLHAHHNYPGGVEQLIADGRDPFDDGFLVVLCRRHHGRLEAQLRRRP